MYNTCINCQRYKDEQEKERRLGRGARLKVKQKVAWSDKDRWRLEQDRIMYINHYKEMMEEYGEISGRNTAVLKEIEYQIIALNFMLERPILEDVLRIDEIKHTDVYRAIRDYIRTQEENPAAGDG